MGVYNIMPFDVQGFIICTAVWASRVWSTRLQYSAGTKENPANTYTELNLIT